MREFLPPPSLLDSCLKCNNNKILFFNYYTNKKDGFLIF